MRLSKLELAILTTEPHRRMAEHGIESNSGDCSIRPEPFARTKSRTHALCCRQVSYDRVYSCGDTKPVEFP